MEKIKQREAWLKNNPYYYENYRFINKEKLKAYNKNYKLKNPDKSYEYNKTYYQKQKTKMKIEKLLFDKLEKEENIKQQIKNKINDVNKCKIDLEAIYDPITCKFNIPRVSI
tara:strand:- start:385 stop:720 length:336 start_codon:yes stop_codon:yes gene_type:complete